MMMKITLTQEHFETFLSLRRPFLNILHTRARCVCVSGNLFGRKLRPKAVGQSAICRGGEGIIFISFHQAAAADADDDAERCSSAGGAL